MTEQIQRTRRKRREVTTEELKDSFAAERSKADRDRLNRLLGRSAEIVDNIDEVTSDE